MKSIILAMVALQMSGPTLASTLAKDIFFYPEECSKQSLGVETVMVCGDENHTLKFYIEGCSKSSAGVETLIRCDLDSLLKD